MSLFVSYHPDQISWRSRLDKYADDWRSVNLGDFDEIALERLARCVTSFVWSPTVYSGDRRTDDDFMESRIVGLDFDKNASIASAKKDFFRYRHIIGTTHHHQKEKDGKPPCDRFRVVLFVKEPITDLLLYKGTVRRYVEEYGSDRRCIDGARLFKPCATIVSASATGEWLELGEPDREYVVRFDPKYSGCRTIPPPYERWLKYGPPPKYSRDRNFACHITMRELLRRGFTDDEALNIVFKSALPIAQDEKRLRELRHCLKSARKQLAKTMKGNAGGEEEK